MASLPTPGVTEDWGDDLNAAIESLHQTGDHASRPASDLVTGTLYSCSDHALVYRWDGDSWETWATLGGDASGAVTAEGTITKIDGPMTQATYDGITPAADTLYVIVG